MARPFRLAGLLIALLAALPSEARAAESGDVMLSFTIVSAPWQAASRNVARETVVRAWPQPFLDRSVEDPAFLERATGLDLGTTRLLARPLVLADWGRPTRLDVQTARGGQAMSLEVIAEPTPGADWTLRTRVSLSGPFPGTAHRTIDLVPDRPQLWLIPTADEMLGVSVMAHPTHPMPPPPPVVVLDPPPTFLSIELAVLRAPWLRPAAMQWIRGSAFDTWLDPFSRRLTGSLGPFLAPLVSAGVGPAEAVTVPHIHARLGELAVVSSTRLSDSPLRLRDRVDPLAADVEIAVDTAAVPFAPGRYQLFVTLRGDSLVGPDSAVARVLDVKEGGLHVWLIPTTDDLVAVFARVKKRR